MGEVEVLPDERVIREGPGGPPRVSYVEVVVSSSLEEVVATFHVEVGRPLGQEAVPIDR